jgi:hypothetical protein
LLTAAFLFTLAALLTAAWLATLLTSTRLDLLTAARLVLLTATWLATLLTSARLTASGLLMFVFLICHFGSPLVSS